MSRGRFALDTNVAIAVLEGEDTVVERWSTVETALLPAPVLGELLFGAHKSARPAENEGRVLHLADAMVSAPCDQAVCAEYGRLKGALMRAGRPIPENDLWIAACSVALDATLVTKDAHFAVVPGLRREEW
jgi:tRNA(fMet)-specific endonuclease VapC